MHNDVYLTYHVCWYVKNDIEIDVLATRYFYIMNILRAPKYS